MAESNSSKPTQMKLLSLDGGGNNNQQSSPLDDDNSLESKVLISNTTKENDTKPEPSKQKDLNFDTAASTNFSQTDCLRFQRRLFEGLEELRIRRVVDRENEDRIRALIDEKHAMESKYEAAVNKSMEDISYHKKELASAKSSWQEQMKQHNAEKAKAITSQDSVEKELKSLRDEIRNLQLNKYKLENKIRQQEHKLSLSESQHESGLSQVTKLEEKCVKLNSLLNQLTEDQDVLAKNVEESKNINRALMYHKNHQQCEISRQKTQISTLQRQLATARLSLDAEPTEHRKELAEVESKVSALTHQRDNANKKIDELKFAVASKEQELLTLKTQMNDALNLISKLKSNYEKVQKQNETFIEDLKMASEAHRLLQEKYEDSKGQAKKLNEKLASQEQDHSRQIENSERLYCTLKKSFDELSQELEEKTSNWTTKNNELSIKVDTLQEILNKPKVEAEVQASVETNTRDCQTAYDHTHAECQTTEAEKCHVGTMVEKVQYKDNQVQAQPVVSNQLIQAIPCLTTSFAQTDKATSAMVTKDASTITDNVASPPKDMHIGHIGFSSNESLKASHHETRADGMHMPPDADTPKIIPQSYHTPSVTSTVATNMASEKPNKGKEPTLSEPNKLPNKLLENENKCPTSGKEEQSLVAGKEALVLDASQGRGSGDATEPHQRDGDALYLSQEGELSPYSRYTMAMKKYQSPKKSELLNSIETDIDLTLTQSPAGPRSSFTFASKKSPIGEKRKLSTKYQSKRRKENTKSESEPELLFTKFPENLSQESVVSDSMIPESPQPKGILQSVERTPKGRNIRFRENLTETKFISPPSSSEDFRHTHKNRCATESYDIEDSSDDERPSLSSRIGSI